MRNLASVTAVRRDVAPAHQSGRSPDPLARSAQGSVHPSVDLVEQAEAERFARALEKTEGALRLADGARAEIRGGALELRDSEERMLVRYVDGTAEIHAPARDLKLVAPGGRVVVQAGTDLCLEAGRDLRHRAARRVELAACEGAQQLELEPGRTHLRATKLDIEAKQSRLATGTATIVARAITTTAERFASHVERYELRAERVVERIRDALREVSGLADTRIGRARTRVSETFALQTRRTVLQSEEETSIDGKRVLLG